jgi:nitric oxide reductase large subunit
MENQAVQDKPTAAFVLSLIGGIIGLIVGFVLIGIALSINASSYYYYGYYYNSSVGLFLGFGVWTLITSIIVIVAASQLHSDPRSHTRWGIVILVSSIIGLGWWLLGIIGGIMALVYKPEAPLSRAPPPPPMQAVTRICPECGRVLSEDVKFCPYCGKELG